MAKRFTGRTASGRRLDGLSHGGVRRSRSGHEPEIRACQSDAALPLWRGMRASHASNRRRSLRTTSEHPDRPFDHDCFAVAKRKSAEAVPRRLVLVRSDSAGAGSPCARFAPRATVRDTHRTMSEESTTPDLVELVRRAVEAANRRDLDAVASSFAEDATFDGRVVGDHFEGRAAIRSFLEDWFGTYEELEVGLEEVRDLGNRVVFAVVVQNGRPAGSAGHLRQRDGRWDQRPRGPSPGPATWPTRSPTDHSRRTGGGRRTARSPLAAESPAACPAAGRSRRRWSPDRGACSCGRPARRRRGARGAAWRGIAR
jgi:uncharacterized protein (TIGR02246 family)